MVMELVAIRDETSFSTWKLVPANIGVPILFTTKAEKWRGISFMKNVVWTSPSTLSPDSPSTCSTECLVGWML